MRVEISEEAEAQIQRVDAWWREHRPAAPDLFTDELEAALIALGEPPTPGVAYEPKPPIRRLLMRRSHYHLYFVVGGDAVTVVAVWNGFRGRGPRL